MTTHRCKMRQNKIYLMYNNHRQMRKGTQWTKKDKMMPKTWKVTKQTQNECSQHDFLWFGPVLEVWVESSVPINLTHVYSVFNSMWWFFFFSLQQLTVTWIKILIAKVRSSFHWVELKSGLTAAASQQPSVFKTWFNRCKMSPKRCKMTNTKWTQRF